SLPDLNDDAPGNAYFNLVPPCPADVRDPLADRRPTAAATACHRAESDPLPILPADRAQRNGRAYDNAEPAGAAGRCAGRHTATGPDQGYGGPSVQPCGPGRCAARLPARHPAVPREPVGYRAWRRH